MATRTAEEVKISAGSAKALQRLLDAAVDNTNAGSMRPEDAEEARVQYARAVLAMRKLIAKLEAKCP